VPDSGELVCDVRADTLDALRAVVGAVPEEIGGARLEAALMREWPGMDSREATVSLLERASAAIGRPIVAARRGGASDASHFAPSIPLTVDGLGPLGGGAHAPHEFVLVSGLRPRAEVALALVDAVLAR
jgi:glutamate carboxypeptidase